MSTVFLLQSLNLPPRLAGTHCFHIAKPIKFWFAQGAMNAKAKLSDLLDALEFDLPEHYTGYDRQTGQLVTVEESVLRDVEAGDLEALSTLAQWQKQEVELARAILADTGARFIDPPDKFEFHEYRHMERFIGTVDAPAAEQLWRAIKGKGAFRYFKDMLHRLGLQEQWYRYRQNAMKEFVIAWAEQNQVPYIDDRPPA